MIPAYNEERRIASTLQQVLAYLEHQTYKWEVLVADDGSADATPKLVSGMAQSRGDGRLRHLRLSHGGKGWAVRHGMLQAQGQHRFMCDADLSMSIDQLERFLPPSATGYDVAAGSRTAPGARRIGEPARRKVTAKAFSMLVRALAPTGVADTQCGFKCFTAEAARTLFSLATPRRLCLRRRTPVPRPQAGPAHPRSAHRVASLPREQGEAVAGLGPHGPRPSPSPLGLHARAIRARR